MKVLKFSAVLLLAVGMFSTAAIANDPANDCAGAALAPGGLDPCLDKTPTGPLGDCTSGGSLYDVWVRFVAPATSTRVRTDLTSAGTDSDYIVWDACGGNKIGCSEDEGAGFRGNICVGGLTVGATYYVQLGAWAAGQNPYGVPPGPGNPYLYSCGVYNVDIVAAGNCGDGTLDCAEDCDDSNTTACDGCSPVCTVESCGDGVVCPPEICDDAGESATCDSDCTLAACGDGTINATAGEQCDDGNTTPGDGCSATCQLPVCGDGSVDVGEDCDPPGSTPVVCGAGGSCNSICKCIDGIPAVSEWGLAVLTLIGLVSGTILFGRRRVAVN